MEFISILGNTGFLACRRCKFSVLPSSITSHFSGSPHYLSTDERGKILSVVERYPELVRDLPGLNGVEIPTSFPYFFPDLSLYSNGFQCQDCFYLSRDRQTIVKHYRKEHGWENPRKRGEKLVEREEDVPWKSGVHCQRFLPQGSKRSYFQVDPRRAFGTEARPGVASSDEGDEGEEVRENRENRSRSYSIRSQGIFLSYSNVK